MKGKQPGLVIIDDLIPENGAPDWEKVIDPELGEVNVLQGEHSTVMTNMEPGGWVQTKDGSYVSVEYAESLNRAQRRKKGIKL